MNFGNSDWVGATAPILFRNFYTPLNRRCLNGLYYDNTIGHIDLVRTTLRERRLLMKSERKELIEEILSVALIVTGVITKVGLLTVIGVIFLIKSI